MHDALRQLDKNLEEELERLCRPKKDEDKIGMVAGFGGYAEGYLAYAGNSASSMSPVIDTCLRPARFNHSGAMDPSVAGGLRLGLWFVRGGLLGQALPAWAQYIGFYTDFSYQRLNFAKQAHPIPGTDFATSFFSEGSAATWSFMFAGRYGFLPDKEVPFGRLQPYVAVGPGIMFTSQNPTFRVSSPFGAVESFEPGSQSAAVICLVVDAGVRYMALKNVSIDVFFKYRHAQPSFTYNVLDPHNVMRSSVTLNPTLNLFSANVGVAYHF